jgi:hypothetical protein
VRALHGFLGLAGYYRKFVHDYGCIVAPLTALLRKEGFGWSDVAAAAFVELKTTLTMAPVLALPALDKLFIMECDASSAGFGAVLLQDKRLMAFFSSPAAPRNAFLAELIGLIHAICWRPYLWGRHFLVRTDHYSLKFLPD